MWLYPISSFFLLLSLTLTHLIHRSHIAFKLTVIQPLIQLFPFIFLSNAYTQSCRPIALSTTLYSTPLDPVHDSHC